MDCVEKVPTINKKKMKTKNALIMLKKQMEWKRAKVLILLRK